MKILFLMSEFPKISETFILHQITHLEKLGNSLTLFALGKPKEKKVHDRAKSLLPKVKYLKSIFNPFVWYLNVYHLFESPLKYINLFLTSILGGIPIRKFIQTWHFIYLLKNQEEKIDLIHAHFGFAGNVGVLIKKYFDIPLITYFYGIDASPIKFSPKNYKALFRTGDVFFALSNAMVNDLDDLGCESEKIKIMHVGIDSGEFIGVKPKKDRFESKVILAVGRLEEKKGFNDLIYAFADVRAKIRKSKVIIIGSGEKERELKRLAKSLGLKRDVKFLGSKTYDEVLIHLAGCNLLCAPSYTAKSGDKEGTPMILMDAGGLSVPVVSTYHSGIPEVVKNGRTGILVKERDIKGLSNAMTKVLSDSDLASRLGKNAKEHVEREFNMEVQAGKINDVYEELVG